MHKESKRILIWTILILLLLAGPTGCKTGCVNTLQSGKSMLIGIVTDVDLQLPVNKVTVKIENTSNNKVFTDSTDIQGRYKISCDPGYYKLKATRNGYTSFEKQVIVGQGSSQEDFYIAKIKEKPCSLEGTILDEETGKPVPNCSVQIGMNLIRSDEKGYFRLDELQEGEYGIWISAPGYDALNKTVTLTRGMNVGKFTLKKMGDEKGQNTVKKRNQEYAVDPTFLGDYICDCTRIVQPNKGTRKYRILSQDMYNQYVKFDEGINKGEMVKSNEGVFANLGKNWEKLNELEIPSDPSDVIKFDLVPIINFFNFVDKDLIVTYKGNETVNGYQTKKYTVVSTASAPAQKKCNLEIWIIDKHPRLDINHAITRIKGRTVPEPPDFNIWAEVEMNFTKIGEGNKISIPSIKK